MASVLRAKSKWGSNFSPNASAIEGSRSASKTHLSRKISLFEATICKTFENLVACSNLSRSDPLHLSHLIVENMEF